MIVVSFLYLYMSRVSPIVEAAAYGLASANPILADIKTGKLAANVINGRYLISREAAESYIAANEYEPEEGSL